MKFANSLLLHLANPLSNVNSVHKFICVNLSSSQRHSHLSEEEWRDVLFDLLHMQKVSFSCVEEQTCYEVCV